MEKIKTKKEEAECKKTTIGGQALIEGLMMIGPDKKAMAVRRSNGEIVVEELPANKWSGSANIPFVRGSVRLFRQLVSGTKALLKSAEYMEEGMEEETAPSSPSAVSVAAAATVEGISAADIPEAEKTEADQQSEKINTVESVKVEKKQSKLDMFLEKHSDLMLYFSAILGILFSIVLFILLPGLLTDLLREYVFKSDLTSRSATLSLALVEGVIRITIFVSYLVLASKMKDIKRVWMYHGAEHKTIACYEAREELTVENTRKFSRFHPRCGTAFMFTVIIVSIIVFAFLGWRNRWLNMLIRFALVPAIAGISYEIIRITGRFDNKFTRAIAAPGLWMQRLTTADPDDSMLEVAITAMKAVLPKEDDKDNW